MDLRLGARKRQWTSVPSAVPPYLTRAGFAVVDCPALTVQQKNAADIRIVLDVLSCLDAETRYDEFVIASSDSDFTPLLQKLRASDRRTVIMSSDSTSPAYRSVAHAVLDAEDVVALVSEPDDVSYEPTIQSPDSSDQTVAESRERAERAIVEIIRASDQPVLLSKLGVEVRKIVERPMLDSTSWFGHGSLSALVSVAGDGAFVTEGHFAWEPARHERPVALDRGNDAELPSVINDLCKVADLPRLSSPAWKAILGKLIEYAAGHEFVFAESTGWVRDELSETETPIGRHVVGFVLRALAIGGASLSGATLPQRVDCVDAIISTISDRAASTGWELEDAEIEIFRRWLDGDGEDESEGTVADRDSTTPVNRGESARQLT